jgi:phage gpG-like protein
MADLSMKQFQNKIQKWASKEPFYVVRALRTATEEVRTRSVTRYLNNKTVGPVGLVRRTGRLVNSINTKVFQEGGKVHGTVGSSLVYSRIHELGGKTGRGAVMPARPYLSTALEDRRESVNDLILESLMRGYRSTNG